MLPNKKTEKQKQRKGDEEEVINKRRQKNSPVHAHTCHFTGQSLSGIIHHLLFPVSYFSRNVESEESDSRGWN